MIGSECIAYILVNQIALIHPVIENSISTDIIRFIPIFALFVVNLRDTRIISDLSRASSQCVSGDDSGFHLSVDRQTERINRD